MSKNIMVFGCGGLQETLIKNVKSLGHFAVGIDVDENAVSRNLCDKFYVVKGDDFTGTCKIVELHKIDGIVTAASDKPLEMMARIAEKYSFPFPRLDSIQKTTQKHLLKNLLINNSIPTAQFYLLDGKNNGFKRNNNLVFPLIVKPVDNSGSRGVVHCETETELNKNIKKALNYSEAKKVLVEEYIGGEEFSVESLISNKVLYVIQITKKITSEPPFNVELGHLQPAEVNPLIFGKIVDSINRMIKVIGLNNCACHTELKVFNETPYIIENGARLGGDYITAVLTPLSTGINIEQELIKISLGEEFVYPEKEIGYSYIRYFNLPEGIIEYAPNLFNEIKHNDLVTIKFFLQNGNRIPKITNSLDRYGFIIVKGTSKEEVFSSMDQIYNEILQNILIKKDGIIC